MRTIHELTRHLSPEALSRYTGTDWTKYVNYLQNAPCSYPISLVKLHNKELVIRSWNANQRFSYYTLHDSIHTLWLNGKAKTNMQSQLLLPGSFISVSHHALFIIDSIEPSVSLHLYEK
jgi:hypothetical protein